MTFSQGLAEGDMGLGRGDGRLRDVGVPVGVARVRPLCG